MDSELLASKTDRVDAPHVSALNDLVRGWREQWPNRSMLWFDPDDGGIDARVLILMEAPGPRNIPSEAHGFCTEDNADPTARSLAQERTRAGLQRADYVRWNIVPWLPVGKDGKWQSPQPIDLEEAMEPLTQVRKLLPELQLVITVGRPALHGWTRQQTLFHQDVVPLLAVPHPSQRNTKGRAESLNGGVMHCLLLHASRDQGNDSDSCHHLLDARCIDDLTFNYAQPMGGVATGESRRNHESSPVRASGTSVGRNARHLDCSSCECIHAGNGR